MCYEALVDEESTEKPVRELVREEMGSAVTDAGIATTAVVAMLLLVGTAPVLVVGAAVATPVLAVLLHQAVLVAGVGIVRWRTSSGESAHSDSVTP